MHVNPTITSCREHTQQYLLLAEINLLKIFGVDHSRLPGQFLVILIVCYPVKQFPSDLLTEAILCTIQYKQLLARLFILCAVFTECIASRTSLFGICRETHNTVKCGYRVAPFRPTLPPMHKVLWLRSIKPGHSLFVM